MRFPSLLDSISKDILFAKYAMKDLEMAHFCEMKLLKKVHFCEQFRNTSQLLLKNEHVLLTQTAWEAVSWYSCEKAIAEFGNSKFLRNEGAQNGSFLRNISKFCNTFQQLVLNCYSFLSNRC